VAGSRTPASAAVRPTTSASGDPAVQQLLAQRQAAAMNEDEELLADIDKQLVDLGFVEYKH
jgi:hypothetical protein